MSKTPKLSPDIIKQGATARHGLFLCINEHAEQVTAELISHGIDAACYHSQNDNEYILDDFSNVA